MTGLTRADDLELSELFAAEGNPLMSDDFGHAFETEGSPARSDSDVGGSGALYKEEASEWSVSALVTDDGDAQESGLGELDFEGLGNREEDASDGYDDLYDDDLGTWTGE